MIVYDGLTNLTWFMGIIEDVGDPTNNGRVKIRAFGFHPTLEEDSVSTDDLPWAYVLGVSPHMHVPLDRGELVFGAFLDGRDAQQPLVFGTIPTPKFGVPVTAGGGGAADSGQAGSSGVSGFTQGPAPVPSTDASKEAFDYFVSQGWTPEQAAGIVGNLQVESGANISHTAVGDNGQAYGIAQWHPDRQAEFESVFGIPIQQSTYEQQLQFVNYELTQGNEQAAGRALSSAQTAEEAAAIVDKKYERSSGASIAQRQSNAGNIYGLHAGSNAPLSGMPPTNPYLKNSPEVIDNFGNKALPPQATGEDLHKTPVAAATTNSKTYSSSYGGANTPTAYTMSHPGVPVGGSYKTGVWNARYDGSYIEMHAGSSRDDEHINVVHRSGSHIILDQNGNITINSVGRVHIATTNNLEEHVDGYTTNVSKGGYTVVVDGGGLTLASSGDINITSNSNINFGAGGNIWMTAGGAAGISAPKIGMTAEAGIISMLAGQNIAMQSAGDITNKAANMVLNASGKLGIQSTGDFAIKGDNIIFSGSTVGIKSSGTATIKAGGRANIVGSQVHLNDGGDVSDATIISVPDTGGAVKPEGPVGAPPPMGVGAGKSAKTNAPKPGSISITDIDETGYSV